MLGFLGGAVNYVNQSRTLLFSLVALMLSGWFVFQVGSILFSRWKGQDAIVANSAKAPGQGGARNAGPAFVPGSPAADSKTMAWLTASVSGRWEAVAMGQRPAGSIPDRSGAGPIYLPDGSEFVAGQRWNLVSGLAEITFRSGAKIILNAPARFSVTSSMAANLQVGKLTAKVPHVATGFTVSTPAGNVVDLGTEFGVEVTSDRKLDVQVFVGEVKVDRSADGTGSGAEPPTHVVAGQTVHIEPGKPTTIVASKDQRFHRDLTLADDSSQKETAAYLDFVRKLKPVVWYRMEGKPTERTIHDEMGRAAEDGKLHWDGPGNPFVDGRVGKALWLRGPKLKDYAVFGDYPKAKHNKLSVSAWVFADSRPTFATVLSNGYAQHGRGQFHLGLLSPEAISKSTGARHFLDGEDIGVQIDQANGEKTDVSEGQGHLFPLNEWQHVAFVADGSTLRLYRQGKEVGSTQYNGLACPVTLKQLSIGVTVDETGKPVSNIPGYWSGQIDEVLIFNGALTPDEIKKLAAAPGR